jgi:acetolactate synthase-1/2/3 large subunit
MNAADVVADILKREGTRYLPCYPRNNAIDAAAKVGIRPILCRQERVGVGMADGISRVTNGAEIGVFAPQAGPGIENAFAGVAQAYADNVPVLVIPGAGPLDRQYNHPNFSAVDNFRLVTKWAAKATHPRQIPGMMRRAYHLMRNGRPGPVLLEIPVEVFEAPFEGKYAYTPARAIRSAPDPADVTAAAKLLKSAKNLVILAGQGVLVSGAGDELVALAEILDAPVLTTNPGKSAFPENHPLSLGGAAVSAPRPLTDYLKKADRVFAIGSSLTDNPFNPKVPAGKAIVHSTADSADINKDTIAELGLVGDAKLTLRALIDELGGAKARRKRPRTDVREAKRKWLAEWRAQLDSDEVPVNQYRVIRDMMKVVDLDNTIVTHDSGSPREQLLPFWEARAPRSYLGFGKSTQLGQGLGLIMGAKLAAPEKLCINVMGDAAIGMVGMDIETAARDGIAILTVVFNNGVMAAERKSIPLSAKKYGALTVSGNYAPMAEALGVAGYRVETPGEIVPQLEKAIATTEAGKPALLEVIVKEGYDFSQYS